MSKRSLKVYLVAGEPSGDLLASRLMRALKKNGAVSCYGVGGESMKKEGVRSLFPISEISVMGFLEVVPRIPNILKRIRQTLDDIEKKKPDIVITVDSWSFSKRIHLGIKKRGLKIPHIHYVAPQVWAWKEKRAAQIKKWVDFLMVLLPFEKKYFEPYQMPCSFVGHPVIEGGADKGDANRFLRKHGFSMRDFILTVLPGSRHTEVSYLLPVFRQVVEELSKENKNLKVVIPTVDTVKKKVLSAIKDWPVQTIVVSGETERYDAFAASALGLAASGTVSLELAMSGTPHLIAYKVNKMSAALARHLLKIKYVNLINILKNKQVIPELLQDDCNFKRIVVELKKLMGKNGAEQKRQAKEALKLLQPETKGLPSQNAAKEVRRIVREYGPF